VAFDAIPGKERFEELIEFIGGATFRHQSNQQKY
jgi:hypothetical protein